MWSETVGLRTRPVWDQKNRSWSWSTVTKFNNSRRISGLTSRRLRQPHALGQDWQSLLATAALRSNNFFQKSKIYFSRKQNVSKNRNYIFLKFNILFFQKTKLFFFSEFKNIFPKLKSRIFSQKLKKNIFVNWVAPVRFRTTAWKRWRFLFVFFRKVNIYS